MRGSQFRTATNDGLKYTSKTPYLLRELTGRSALADSRRDGHRSIPHLTILDQQFDRVLAYIRLYTVKL